MNTTPLPCTLTTADLPATMRLDTARFDTARAAINAGLSLPADHCRCTLARADCPMCIAALLQALPARERRYRPRAGIIGV